MARPKKSFVTLAEDLKKIRKRPLTQAEVDKANCAFEEMERERNLDIKLTNRTVKRTI